MAVNGPPLVSAESQLRNLMQTFNRACVSGIEGARLCFTVLTA